MESASRLPALIAYIPVLGWIYVLVFQHDNPLAVFHMRQSIGLFLFMAAVMGGWIALTWLTSWFPFGFLIGMMLFTIVITALIFAVIAWVIGIINALQGRVALLPVFGRMANRLPL